jgi:sec-independent protein translocase protein TatA
MIAGRGPRRLKMLSGISWPQLLIVLVIVLAIFGTKRFRSLGSDLGNAIKGFRSAMTDAEEAKDQLSEDKSENKSEDANFDNTPVEEPRKDK